MNAGSRKLKFGQENEMECEDTYFTFACTRWMAPAGVWICFQRSSSAPCPAFAIFFARAYPSSLFMNDGQQVTQR